MKKFFATAMVVFSMVAMMMGSCPEAQAQHTVTYEQFCHDLPYNNCREHLQKGDDFYREGKYDQAIAEYKEARDDNERFCHPKCVDPSVIEHKLDKCYDAKRFGPERMARHEDHHADHRHHHHHEKSEDEKTAEAVSALLDVLFK